MFQRLLLQNGKFTAGYSEQDLSSSISSAQGSNGRAQLIVGRGSLTESFPLFGLDLADYETLFEEKLDLLTRLLRDQPVTWSGTVRSPLTDQFVSPPLPEGHIPTWVGVGGSPESVIRAARYGLPLMLAIIGGDPARFAPYVDLYNSALDEYGRTPQPVGMHSLGFIADTDDKAVAIQWPHYQKLLAAASRERGWSPPTLSQFHTEIANGSLYVGSPATIATKLATAIRTLGLSRFDLAYAVGEIPHEQRMATIELYGREVIPRVRELLATEPIQAKVA
jgi:alkanesulfonate monooxygenase SsuD/methylene tetrahydromethanopterin reductase-like flavin-dependent oxidoreductase (luciferase family)